MFTLGFLWLGLGLTIGMVVYHQVPPDPPCAKCEHYDGEEHCLNDPKSAKDNRSPWAIARDGKFCKRFRLTSIGSG